ncbi:TetR/AcrR family transcriptional regulator [Vulgatibacter incomptus]|uniref:TetR family transcriptional regulator n=1 Tax=Vulgatibacter incomptus TaxID=1391653 RepID=A0A0K1PFZ8_9BACT|nr:TetR/AcrR family transcriptional regulator [Vulgatibacter incomptus]AKU92341.1 TetR family transcriptional regulator [Vulgatibacter incomptus]
MKVTPRRAREIARTRQDILEAAARAFVHSGLKAATMQDIAKEAGYTAASLYGYFSSKEEILKGLHQLIAEEVTGVFDTPIPGGLTFRQKLELLLQRQLEVAMRRRDLIALFHVSGPFADGRCPGDEMSTFERRVELFANFIRQHAAPAELHGRDPRDAALSIAGVTFIFYLDMMKTGETTRFEDRLPRVLDLVLYGVLGAPA